MHARKQRQADGFAADTFGIGKTSLRITHVFIQRELVEGLVVDAKTDTVLVHREGQAVVVEPVDEWPEGYVESFAGVPDDFTRPSQGEADKRTSLG